MNGGVGGALYTLLQPQAVGGFRMNTFSESGAAPPVTPAIRGTLVSSTPQTTICGSGADESVDDLRVQLDIVDRDYDDMVSCRLRVIAALAADTRPWTRGSVTETYDVETKLHRCYFDVNLGL